MKEVAAIPKVAETKKQEEDAKAAERKARQGPVRAR